jgi:hypothetical protein
MKKVDAEFLDDPPKRRRTHSRRVHRRVRRAPDLWQLYSFLDGLAHISQKQLASVRALLRAIAEDDAIWLTLETAREHERERAETIEQLRATCKQLEKRFA